MPRLKPLYPEENMRREFFSQIERHAILFGLQRDEQIAELIGLSPSNYCKRKSSTASWNMNDLATVFKKLNFSDAEIANVFRKGAKL